jgi:serine/threonine-protein kinase
MRAGRPSSWLSVLLAALAVLLVGCADDPRTTVPAWTLTVAGQAPKQVHLPATFVATLPAQPSRYELRTDLPLQLELRGRPLVLTLPAIDAFAVLRVDDEVLEPLGRSIFDRVRPSDRRLVFRIPARATDRDVLPLVLEVQHRDSFTEGLWAAPRIEPGAHDSSPPLVVRTLEQDLVVGMIVVFVLLGLASGAAFALDRRRVSAGWYAAMTVSLAAWHLTILGATQLLDPRDLVRFPIVTTTLIAISGVAFVHAHFGLGTVPRWLLAALGGLGASALASCWRPFSSMTAASWLLNALIVLAITYLLARLGKLALRGPKRVEAAAMCAVWLFIGAAALRGSPFMRPIAWLTFVLVQAALLARAYTESLRRLNMQLAVRVTLLEDRNRDVARLNDELRRQIGDRSARLAEALSNIGSVPSGRREPLREGVVLVDRYRIVRTLGAGAMGAVYEVERTTDGRRLALKTVIHAHGSALARLAREAEIATRVAHPNLVGIVDIDVAPSGVMFIVMELVHGRPLSTEAQRFGDVPWAKGILRQVAAGLRALHDAGVVHRDLKPANVLLEPVEGRPPRAKIADFGIARSTGGTDPPPPDDAGVDPEGATMEATTFEKAKRESSDAPLTRTGVVMGTPLYMAPELLAGAKDAPPSSDMWSFGVMACELLTGKRPFTESPVMRALEGRTSAPPPLDTTGLPVSLTTVVLGCLERDPARRPTAADAERAFQD